MRLNETVPELLLDSRLIMGETRGGSERTLCATSYIMGSMPRRFSVEKAGIIILRCLRCSFPVVDSIPLPNKSPVTLPERSAFWGESRWGNPT
jgi:hypothetical protein